MLLLLLLLVVVVLLIKGGWLEGAPERSMLRVRGCLLDAACWMQQQLLLSPFKRLLVLLYCRNRYTHPDSLVLSVFPIVMIGDYDSSRPLDESVQLREVSFAAVSVEHVVTGQGDGGAILGPSNLAVGLLREPVTLPGFTAAVMNDDAEQPVPFQNVTVVGYGADATPVGQNLTEWPGPALEATMTATSQATCSVLSRLYDVAMYADSAYLCAQPAGPDEAAVPCEGARHQPACLRAFHRPPIPYRCVRPFSRPSRCSLS